MAVTPEGVVKKQIKAVLAGHKAWFFMPVSGGFGTHGIPDFVGCHNGRCFGVEAKAPGKKASALQLLQKSLMEAAGAQWFLVDGPESLKELAQWMDGNEIQSTT